MNEKEAGDDPLVKDVKIWILSFANAKQCDQNFATTASLWSQF